MGPRRCRREDETSQAPCWRALVPCFNGAAAMSPRKTSRCRLDDDTVGIASMGPRRCRRGRPPPVADRRRLPEPRAMLQWGRGDVAAKT